MANGGPSILVVGNEWSERVRISAVLRGAGFPVVAAADERSAAAELKRQRFAAAVVALPEDDGAAFLRRARRRQAGLKALVIAEPGSGLLGEDDAATMVKRLFDDRDVLGYVFELVLRGSISETPQHDRMAESGIAAAKNACLNSQQSVAA